MPQLHFAQGEGLSVLLLLQNNFCLGFAQGGSFLATSVLAPYSVDFQS